MNVKKLGLIVIISVSLLMIVVFIQNDRYKVEEVLTDSTEEVALPSSSSDSTVEEGLELTSEEKIVINSGFKIYSSDNITFEELNYVSDETFERIAEISRGIQFRGIFGIEDLSENSFYRKQYWEALKEESYINRLEEKGYSDLVEYDSQSMEKYSYYFFDMNRDEVPELMVFGNMRYIHIFSYNTKTNKIELVCVEKLGSNYFMGNDKIGAWYGGTGLTYEFYELDENGDRNSKIFFHSEGFFNDSSQSEDEIYLVGFEEGSSEIENFKLLAKEMGEQLYEENAIYFLRISKEQYDQVTKNYFESRKVAEKNIEEVTYTFKELFGDIGIRKIEALPWNGKNIIKQ